VTLLGQPALYRAAQLKVGVQNAKIGQSFLLDTRLVDTPMLLIVSNIFIIIEILEITLCSFSATLMTIASLRTRYSSSSNAFSIICITICVLKRSTPNQASKRSGGGPV
jgi:hypothetical protein